MISATGRIFAASGAVGTPGITFSADSGQDTGFYWISDGNIGVAQNATLRAFFNTSGFSSNGIISASGAITGATTISATGNVDGGNLRTGGLISAAGTVTGTSYIGSVVSVTGSVTAGNIVTGGSISATGRIYSASGTAGGPGITFAADTSQDTGFYWISDGNIGVATNGTLRATFLDTGLSVVANVTGGNILTAGLISATGNISSNAGLYSIAAVDTNKTVIYGDMATNDQFRIQIGGNTNAGFVEFATADDASEPIYFRQYTGAFTTATRTLTLLDGSGNSLFPGMVSATSNVIGGNIRTAGLISATGNVTGNFFIGNGSQLTGITASASGYFISNGTSNIAIASANANAFVTIAGTANVAVFATTGAFITGVVSASGNVTGGNVLTAGLISSTGNAVFGNITSGGGTGGNITGANVVSCTNVKTVATTVAGLPAAATVGAGARAFVTDATSATFGTTATGGASNAVPVWTDGTTWKIG